MKLLNYIRGFRKGKEAHRLEKEAMQDTFLADAMDGYDSIGESQEKQIEQLRKRVTMRATRKKNYAIRWSAVACLLIGVCVGTYFLLQPGHLPEDTLVVMEEAASPIPVPDTPALPTVELVTPSVTKPAAPVVAKAVVPPVKEVVEELTVTAESRMEAMAAVPLSIKKEVSGRVTDKDGTPIIGASIAVKGTNLGTISDLDGKFTLDMGDGKELVVNYIGYESMTLPVDSGKNMLIAMNDDQQTLDEVVVVGYRTSKKNRLIGSVTTKSSKEQSKAMKQQPVIGWKAYRKYLKEELERPTDGPCAGVGGKVILTFRVAENGEPVDIKVKKSLCPDADEAAINVLEDGPNWTLGTELVEITIKF